MKREGEFDVHCHVDTFTTVRVGAAWRLVGWPFPHSCRQLALGLSAGMIRRRLRNLQELKGTEIHFDLIISAGKGGIQHVDVRTESVCMLFVAINRNAGLIQ